MHHLVFTIRELWHQVVIHHQSNVLPFLLIPTECSLCLHTTVIILLIQASSPGILRLIFIVLYMDSSDNISTILPLCRIKSTKQMIPLKHNCIHVTPLSMLENIYWLPVANMITFIMLSFSICLFNLSLSAFLLPSPHPTSISPELIQSPFSRTLFVGTYVCYYCHP